MPTIITNARNRPGNIGQTGNVVGSGPGSTVLGPVGGGIQVPQISFGGILGGIAGAIPGIGPIITGLGGIIGDVLGGGNDCGPGFARGPNNQCQQVVPGGGVVIPGSPGILTPAERGPVGFAGAGAQFVAPSLQSVAVHKCPRFADGKTGILWTNMMNGTISCLPRGVDGKKFGMQRKNPKQAKAVISAADAKLFRRVDSMKKKVQTIAKSAGLKGCNLR